VEVMEPSIPGIAEVCPPQPTSAQARGENGRHPPPIFASFHYKVRAMLVIWHCIAGRLRHAARMADVCVVRVGEDRWLVRGDDSQEGLPLPTLAAAMEVANLWMRLTGGRRMTLVREGMKVTLDADGPEDDDTDALLEFQRTG
jgi:hypothetical protein